MKRAAPAIWISLFLLLSACSSTPSEETAVDPASEVPTQEPWAFPRSLFGTDACFVLFDLQADRVVEVLGEERCRERVPACSTFKVPLAAMAFDTEVLKDLTTKMPWSGKKSMIPAWNRDHSPKSWMRESVVWFSQRLTPRIGRRRIQKYLEKFKYGNQDFSGGLQDAWLTPAPFLKAPPKTSVLVSAYDQIDFLKQLYRGTLPISQPARQLTRRVMTSEKSPKGFIMTGKTGSGFVGEKADLRLGWYVAHLKRGEQEFVSVVTFTDRTPIRKPGFGGLLAKDAMKALLKDRGYW